MTRLPFVRPEADEEIDDAAEAWATLLDVIVPPPPESIGETKRAPGQVAVDEPLGVDAHATVLSERRDT